MEKEKSDKEIQQRASISIPLVPEKDTDVSASKRVNFASSDPTHLRKSQRRDIKTQPLFGGKRNKLQLARLRMDGRLFRGGGSVASGGSSSISRLRTQLGVETKKP